MSFVLSLFRVIPNLSRPVCTHQSCFVRFKNLSRTRILPPNSLTSVSWISKHHQQVIAGSYSQSSSSSSSSSRRNGSSSRLERTKNEIREAKKLVKAQIDDMKENVYTIPNLLSLVRIGLTPCLAYTVLTQQYLTSLSIFIIAGTTDLADGIIARRFPSQRSNLGSFLDPFADKLLIATLFASLTWIELIPLILTALIVTRDVILVIAGLVIRYKSLPEPRTVSKFFDVSMATAQLSPTFLSKFNTTLQLVLVGASLTSAAFDFVDHPAMQVLYYSTAMTTILSGLSYAVSSGTYKIIRNKKIKNKKL